MISPTCAVSDRPTVLIADDEPLLVAALSRMIRRAGMHFIADSTSEHVLELARTHKPAVIVLDVRQPQDGRDLLLRLKKDPQTRYIKVLMLSAVEDQFTRHVCLELGAEDYDLKPFDACFVNKVARLAGVSAGEPSS